MGGQASTIKQPLTGGPGKACPGTLSRESRAIIDVDVLDQLDADVRSEILNKMKNTKNDPRFSSESKEEL